MYRFSPLNFAHDSSAGSERHLFDFSFDSPSLAGESQLFNHESVMGKVAENFVNSSDESEGLEAGWKGRTMRNRKIESPRGSA